MWKVWIGWEIQTDQRAEPVDNLWVLWNKMVFHRKGEGNNEEKPVYYHS
jgi:hypothetical protein